MNSSSQPYLDACQIESFCLAAASGDTGALEQLIRHYHPQFLGFTIRRVGVDWKGKIESEDVLQEAYISVFNSIASYEHRSIDSFYHWVTNIISRRFIDRIRHVRRKQRDVAREVKARYSVQASYDDLLSQCSPDIVTPSLHARRAEATCALLACIERLPDNHRDVVKRRWINEEPVSEIANDLGISEEAVRGLANRAKQTLTKCMGQATKYLSRG